MTERKRTDSFAAWWKVVVRKYCAASKDAEATSLNNLVLLILRNTKHVDRTPIVPSRQLELTGRADLFLPPLAEDESTTVNLC